MPSNSYDLKEIADYLDQHVPSNTDTIEFVFTLRRIADELESANIPRFEEGIKGCWDVHYQHRKMTPTEFDALTQRQWRIRMRPQISADNHGPDGTDYI